tara:strand:- start:19193 stop:19561 length:369 start_codon:yes stop_codon:yes gene_type:complete
MTDRFVEAAPVLRSADYEHSCTFYRNLLGFTIHEEGGDPPRFGIYVRNGAILFINAWDGGPAGHPGGWEAYIHVHEIADVYAEWATAGVPITRPLTDTVYGMKEFEITNPDGNVICFGESQD